ncbi:uncharacterized protein TNCV_128991 [Trichonephila clavipes]|nr:uncharacterized protein TNCV_128991 [Trichonephila clavipes]
MAAASFLPTDLGREDTVEVGHPRTDALTHTVEKNHIPLNCVEQASSVKIISCDTTQPILKAAVAEWYRYRTVACFVTGSSPVPLKTRRVGQRCTLNMSRAETSSRWCGVVVRRGGASSGVVHVT